MPRHLEVTTMEKTWHTENPQNCPIVTSINIIGGKWKPAILHMLSDGTLRFGQIRKNIPPVSQKVLTQQLRELEADEIIERKDLSDASLKVEYSLSEKGKSLMPILDSLYAWGQENGN